VAEEGGEVAYGCVSCVRRKAQHTLFLSEQRRMLAENTGSMQVGASTLSLIKLRTCPADSRQQHNYLRKHTWGQTCAAGLPVCTQRWHFQGMQFLPFGCHLNDTLGPSTQHALLCCSCVDCQGFLLLHSLGGGTGSGLGTYLLGLMEVSLLELGNSCLSIECLFQGLLGLLGGSSGSGLGTCVFGFMEVGLRFLGSCRGRSVMQPPWPAVRGNLVA
jgi:hypothetical protein